MAEFALRFVPRFEPPPNPPRCRRPDLYQVYGPHGYRLWPSRTTTYLYPDRNPRRLMLVSNRDGFRSSRELDEPDQRPRVLVLGDSFVFGEGVEEPERFTNVLEALEPAWRVDSLGMTGFGPDLMVLTLETVGLRCRPRAVVFCMYTDDFRRVRPHYAGVGFEIPRFRLAAGRLQLKGYPPARWWDRLWVTEAVRKFYWNSAEAERQINAALFDRFLELSATHHFSPAIVFVPGVSETRNDSSRRKWLRQYASGKRTPFLDLTEAIRQGGPGLFIPDNPHWNPKGHQVAAREVRRFLAAEVLGQN